MKRIISVVVSATGLAAVVALVRRWRRCCNRAVGGWSDSPAWGSDGLMANVNGFRTFVETARPCWRYDAIASALAIIGVDPGGDAPVGPIGVERHPSAGSGEVDVRLVFDHEGDDSVAATRYRFTFVDEAFVGGIPGAFRLLEGLREFRCHPGRGQTDWGPELCL